MLRWQILMAFVGKGCFEERYEGGKKGWCSCMHNICYTFQCKHVWKFLHRMSEVGVKKSYARCSRRNVTLGWPSMEASNTAIHSPGEWLHRQSSSRGGKDGGSIRGRETQSVCKPLDFVLVKSDRGYFLRASTKRPPWEHLESTFRRYRVLFVATHGEQRGKIER